MMTYGRNTLSVIFGAALGLVVVVAEARPRQNAERMDTERLDPSIVQIMLDTCRDHNENIGSSEVHNAIMRASNRQSADRLTKAGHEPGPCAAQP